MIEIKNSDYAPAGTEIVNGRLYNGYSATDARGIAPEGWHVCTQAEAESLASYVGKKYVNLFDLSFNPVLSGYYSFHEFSGLNGMSMTLTLTGAFEFNYVLVAFQEYNSVGVSVLNNKKVGCSIRCVRDQGNTSTTATDSDGNIYQSVTIGTQTWLTDNLATKHYNNGDPILSDFSGTVGACCAYENNENNVYKIKPQTGFLFTQNTFTYTGNFMGERSISCSVQSPTVLPFDHGCYVNYRNEQFKLDKTPSPTLKKISSENSIINAFQYDLKFISLAFELQLVAFRDLVNYDSTNYYAGTSNVEFTGTVSYLTERIQACLDVVYFGSNRWTIEIEEGLVTTTEKIIATDISCWDALALVNSTVNWKLNFHISDRHIYIGNPKTRIEKSFEYGKGNGLYELSRNVVESESIITRLRVYGSDVNIPSDYKRESGSIGRVAPDYQYITNLMLPSYASIQNHSTHARAKGSWDGSTAYSVGDLVHYSDNKQYYCIRATGSGIIPTDSLYFVEWPADYIDSPNIDKYGVREGVFRDESIHPSIVGVTISDLENNGIINSKTGSTSLINEILAVSKVPADASGSSGNQSYFYAWVRNIGFDIQSSILSGNTPKLELIDSPTGIQGFDFDITAVLEDVTSYNESKYRLTLKRNSSESFIIPNSENNIYLKDDGSNLIPDGVYAHFAITGVSMPLFLTEIAERRLLESGKNYLSKHDSPLSTYSLGVDDIEVARNRSDIHESIMEGQYIGIYDSNIGCGGDIESNGNFSTDIQPRWSSSESDVIFGLDMFGLNILPAGIRTESFYEIGGSCYLWTSDMNDSETAIARKIISDGSELSSVFLGRNVGATVIPVRDIFSGEVGMEDGTLRADVYTDTNGIKYDGIKIGDKVWLSSPLIETKYKGETGADSLIFENTRYKYFHQFVPEFQYEMGAAVLKPSGIVIVAPSGETSPNTDAYYYKTASLPDVWTQLIPSGCRYMGEYRNWINYSLKDIIIVGGVYYRNISSCIGVEVSDSSKWKPEYGYPTVRIDRLISGLTNQEWILADYGSASVYPYSGIFQSESEMINGYGRLYNHYSIENPLGLVNSEYGFRVPSNADFVSLENYLKSKYQTQYSFGCGNLLKSKRQIESPFNAIGAKVSINQYIPIQTLSIKEGFSQIPSYDITLSNDPISSTLNSISNSIGANSAAIGRTSSNLYNAIKTTGKDITAVKAIIPTTPEATGSEPEITPKSNGILSWLGSSWVFLTDNFVRSCRKINNKSLTEDIVLNTNDILDTVDYRYQTDSQKLYNDATSSIQTQLNNRELSANKGAANGYAPLDSSQKVPSINLPSYVDDVLEFDSYALLPAIGESGKIYITTDSNLTYRWGGTAYIEISSPLDFATKQEAEAGVENSKVMTSLRVFESISHNAILDQNTTVQQANIRIDGNIESGSINTNVQNIPINIGVVILPTLTKLIDGSVNVGGDGTCIFNSLADGSGQNIKLLCSDTRILIPTQGSVSYIYANYNNGSPIYEISTSYVQFFTDARLIPIVRVIRPTGNNLHFEEYDRYGIQLAPKLLFKDVTLNGVQRASGLFLSTSDTRISTVSAGVVWFGVQYYSSAPNVSGSSGLLFEYHIVNGLWVSQTVTSYDSQYYSDGVTRLSLLPNKYVSKYFFKDAGDDNEVYYIHGNSYTKQSDSYIEQIPPVPQIISSHAIYVGKIVIVAGASNGIAYSRLWDEAVQAQTQTDHSNLSNLTWMLSGHTGNQNTIPIFGSGGVASLISTDFYQQKINGTGFVKANGTVLSYDNIEYQPLSTAINTGNIAGQSVNYANNAGNSTKWSGYTLDFNQATTVNRLIAFDSSDNSFRVADAPSTRTFLGLGSSAYTNTGNFIQNQNSSPQSANMWINGKFRNSILNNASFISNWAGPNWFGIGPTISNHLIRLGMTDGDGVFQNAPGDMLFQVDGAATFASTVNATQLQSTVATGTAPLTVNSTTMVSNLNADLLDGNHASAFQPAITGLSTNYLPKWNGSSLVNGLVFDNGTNLGIGYASDQGYKLAVNGDVGVTGAGYFTGNVIAPTFSGQLNVIFYDEATLHNGFVGGAVWINYRGSSAPITNYLFGNGLKSGELATLTASNFLLQSDKTLKTNIKPIIKDYSKLDLVSFNFKDNLNELRFGTIAQDLLDKGFDEFVVGNKEGEYKVKYIDLIIAKLASAELRIKQLEDKYGST